MTFLQPIIGSCENIALETCLESALVFKEKVEHFVIFAPQGREMGCSVDRMGNGNGKATGTVTMSIFPLSLKKITLLQVNATAPATRAQ